MNRENIQKVRDHIAGLERSRFDMRRWGTSPNPVHPECGTPACIGGWTEALLYKRGTDMTRDPILVGRRLGLDRPQTQRLFYPPHPTDWTAITTAGAVRVLDHLLETGEVDWSIIDAPSPSSDRGGS